jgi:hypothetical protein
MIRYIDEDANEEVVITHTRNFLRADGLSGFGFPCDKDGMYIGSLENEGGWKNFQLCLLGQMPGVTDRGVTRHEERRRLCPCGSFKHYWDERDGRGLYLARVCEDCVEKKLAGYRPEVLTSSNYWHDEPIDEDY